LAKSLIFFTAKKFEIHNKKYIFNNKLLLLILQKRHDRNPSPSEIYMYNW
jgi:hypothetical protein